MRFSELLNALPADIDKLCHEISVRNRRDRTVLLKKLLRGAFDAGRYNDPDRQQRPAPFMPDRSTLRDQIEVREMEKWSGLWRTREYRAKECPAGDQVRSAIESLGIKETDSIIDFGCGRGKALQAFHDGGFESVVGLDIASNALDEHVAAHYPLIRACLWNLPDCLYAGYGYCVDVIEHIPAEKVTSVLEGIKASVRYGCFFQIQNVGPHTWDDKLREVWSNWSKVEQVLETADTVQFIAVAG